jgi:hypothetical protein
MTIVISHAALPDPDDAPRLGGLTRLAGLVRRALAASWVPFCPDLMNEVGRGLGRQD